MCPLILEKTHYCTSAPVWPCAPFLNLAQRLATPCSTTNHIICSDQGLGIQRNGMQSCLEPLMFSTRVRSSDNASGWKPGHVILGSHCHANSAPELRTPTEEEWELIGLKPWLSTALHQPDSTAGSASHDQGLSHFMWCVFWKVI